jgi:hypothetical protein
LTWIVVVALCACGGGGEEAASGQDGIPESLQQVPRNRTLILDCVDSGTCAGQMKDYDTFNPYIPGHLRRPDDALVDEMGRTAPDDPKLAELFREAMAIWLREMPSVPLLQWYHRIPHNETYWTNWPSEDNPYINSAYWHRTWLLVLLGLEPAQE